MTILETKNYILHAKSKQFHWEGSGQLSIKTFTNGRAFYKTNRGYFAVLENRYLLLNPGLYSLTIEEEQEVESFCLFFKDGLAEQVYQAYAQSTDHLLTDPFKKIEAISFFEQTYPLHQKLSNQLLQLKKKESQLICQSVDPELPFHHIMESILSNHMDVLKKVESLNSIKLATRKELYKRVRIAYEYILSLYDQPITVEEIAQVACLSTNHLLRSYKQIYQTSPHQHISFLRMEKAKQLLLHDNNKMTEITFELGYQNPASFSKVFKKFFGISPTQYRKKVKMDKNF